MKRCKFCRKEFEPPHPLTAYCSKQCKNRVKHLRQTANRKPSTCEVCGIEFQPTTTRPQKTCSRKCQYQAKTHLKNKDQLHGEHWGNRDGDRT